MKKAFEEAKTEKISVSVVDIVTSSGDTDTAGSFNIGGNASQGWDDIGGSNA